MSKKRKGLYGNDPAYRKNAKASAQAYRKKKKEERDKLRAEGKLPPVKPRGPRKPVEVKIGTAKHPAFTVTIVAQRLDRSVHALNYWTRAGLLPLTPLRSARGDRLYTDAMILVIKMAVFKRGEVSRGDTSFRQEIVDGWKDIGILAVDRVE